MSANYHHTLGLNHANERPKHVVFADVESHLEEVGNHKTLFHPFLWTMVYKNYCKGSTDAPVNKYYGSDITNFWDIVESHTYSKSRTYLVTHHLEVDFMPMKGFPELNNRGWVLDKLISHGKVLIMYWVKDKKKLIIMNNGNLFDGSIAQWGDMFGVPKLSMPSDTASFKDWCTYCMRDTEILVLMWDFLIDFMDLHDLGNFKLSKAGLAMNGFRHRFMNIPIQVHNNALAVDLERKSYKGGRFEALQIGSFKDGVYYNLDINSMYGSIERDCMLPYELRGYAESMSLDLLKRKLGGYAIIAEVEVSQDIPVLPRILNDKIVYKPGTFWTVLTTPEIVYALARGWILHVGKVCWYKQAKVLREFADYFLKLKDQYELEGNKPLRQFAKLYLNSLYGKFGQHGYDDRVIGTCSPDEFSFIETFNADTKLRGTVARYGGKIHETVVTHTGYNTMVSIAAHITAYGRVKLWRLIELAGYENVYHVATDSLVVNQAGYDNLRSEVHNGIPGKLKVEGTFNEITIKDVNDVIQDGLVKIKGIPKKAIQMGENQYKVTTWARLTTLLKQGITDRYYTQEVTKILKRDRYYQVLGVPNPDLKRKITKSSRGIQLELNQDPDYRELKDRLDILHEGRIVSVYDMFRLWDYSNNTFKRIRTIAGRISEVEYSDTEIMAHEYGYETLDEFLREVQWQAQRDSEARAIRLRLDRIHETAKY
jgi:hypothetical protein